MKVSEKIEWHYVSLRSEIIEEIKTIVENNNGDNVELNHGVIHQYVDDQWSEVIPFATKTGVIVDYIGEENELEFNDLSFEELLSVLKNIEN